jgi:hypothetical protein
MNYELVDTVIVGGLSDSIYAIRLAVLFQLLHRVTPIFVNDLCVQTSRTK